MKSDRSPSSPAPDLLAAFGWAGRFELREMIGSGSMGQVWRALERSTGKVVALKMLDPARVGDEQMLARLDIEAATLMKLREAGQHEHVVPILDFKVTDSHACLVMAYIPGLNLKKGCEAHQLGLAARVKLIAQVARACGWFHALGVVHRDLKPANILVHATTQQPVIVDFSIAKLADSLPITLTNEALGTAPYMAPEQLDRSRGAITPATDVYALGATLYELLTHVHPHPGELAQVIKRHQNEDRPARPSLLNKEVPRDLESICLKALSHRPADRYVNGTALAEDLERYLAGQPVQARPMSTFAYAARQARRRPALTAALAACLVIGSFALWNVQRQMAQRERFDLETGLTTAMQRGIWSSSGLEQAESTLTALARHDAALAGQLRQQFHDDVMRDMEATLQQGHLRDEDFTWLRTTAGWLEPRSPAQAGRLQSLIAERLGRWQTQAELRAPFADMQGLFTRSNVRVEGGLLYPVNDLPAGKVSAFMVTQSVSVPMEAACTFVADGASFHHIALSFLHENSSVQTALYKARHVSKSVLASFGESPPDPQSYVLVITHNATFTRSIHIPDTHLLDQPFRLTLRVEREWAEADLNGQSRLRVDSPFAFGSVQATNYWRISWPKDIGLQELILRTRRSDTVSPLERADLLAAQEQWAEARRLYEELRGDPLFGSEADYKTAECLLRQHDHAAAFAIWERLAQGQSSRWSDRSLIQLWVQSVQHRGGVAPSARYLALLPDPLPPAMFQQIDPWLAGDLERAYAPAGMGIALPRVDAAGLTEAVKAYRLLKLPPVQTASRFAMAHHFARLDQAADALYRHGLLDPAASGSQAKNLLAATNCLDQWCRITPSEKNTKLADALAHWQTTLKNDATVQALWRMEQARRAARQGDLHGAVVHADAACESGKTDNRVLTSAWLLEGMLFRLQTREDRAQSAWRKALAVAGTVTMKHPLHLCDCVLLHSLTQSWDLRTAGDVLTPLAGRHLKDAERTAAQAAFNQSFLTDPAWLTTFNAVLQDERGKKFAEDYVLCRDNPRELVQRYYRLLFEHYFLVAAPARAWESRATPEQTARVQRTVDQLVTEMATNPRADSAHLHACLRAWTDPAANGTLFDQPLPYTPALVENMKWLLSMRQRQ